MADLRELVAAATPGPWFADPDLADYDAGLHNVWHGDSEKPDLRAVAHDIFKFEDARLIALAPQLAELCADMGEALATEPFGPRKEPGELLARLDALFPEDA